MLNKMSLLLGAAVIALSCGTASAAHYDRHDDRNANAALTISLGDVAFGYRDGYWDTGHRWHRWSNRSDRDNYRRHGDHYNYRNHDHYDHNGWLSDADGGTVFTAGFGNIAFGYRDGYWDTGHRWHRWSNRSDRDNYRRHGDHYNYRNHDRYDHNGWLSNADSNAPFDRAHGDGGAILSVGFGDVAFGYRDGYWDNGHNWHRWSNTHDRDAYRDGGNNYRSGNHDRYDHEGWRNR